MERKYVYNHNGLMVNVIEAKSDFMHDVQISVMGGKDFTKRPFNEFKDEELITQGFIEVGKVNGSLFFNQGTQSFANGIEKAFGIVNENDDATWDNNLGFYHKGGVPYIVTQAYMKRLINDPSVRGAITAAFGLLNNGIKDTRGGNVGEPCRLIFVQKSGRTIVGKKADNTLVLATFNGVTGVSGLTGDQTVELAKALGLTNAVCMDGGGSTFGSYKGVIFDNSDREGVNAIGLYVRFKVGAKKTLSLTVGEAKDGKVFLKELNVWVDALKF